MPHDDDDLFSDDAMQRAAERRQRSPRKSEAELMAQWEKPRQKRTRKNNNPEKQNQDRIWDHLIKVYGAVPRRINSGSWKTTDGDFIAGAKAGTSDLIAELCIIIDDDIRIGVYFAIETKSMTGKETPAQRKFLDRCSALGGIAVVARTPVDVDAAIDEYVKQLSDRLQRPVRVARRQTLPETR